MAFRLLQIGTVIGLFVWLSGCATLSKEECRSADWRTIGYEDGSNGQLTRRIGAHREACAEAGVTPDLQAYLAGHKEGLKLYCKAPKGFALGQRGVAYNGVCSGDDEYDFLRGYRAGKQVYQLNEKINSFSRNIQQIHNEQHELEDEIKSNEELIVADSTSPKLRKELLRQNKKLEQLIVEKQVHIDGFQHRIDRLKIQASRLVNNFHP